MRKSWIIPSLGGWLSIANLLLLFATIILVQSVESYPKTFFAVVLYALTIPLAIFWMMPSLHGPTYVDVFVVPLVIVVNAFIWGYGIAWLWRYATMLDDLNDREQELLEEARKKTPTANS